MTIPQPVKHLIEKRRAEGLKKTRGRPARWFDPDAIERKYQRTLFDFVDIFEETVNDILLLQLPKLVQEARQELPEAIPVRKDSWANDLSNLISATKLVFNRRTPNPETLAMNIGNEVSDFNKAQFRKVTRSAIGVDIVAAEPYLPTVMNAYAFKNADLIRDLSDKGARDISLIVSDGLAQGLAASEIKKNIAKTFPKMKNRAKLIASDQVGTLNGQLTKFRQTGLGIKQFRWLTMGDDRVRDEHSALNGKIFDWDDPPSIGIPKQPIRCRCIAEPIFPEELENL